MFIINFFLQFWYETVKKEDIKRLITWKGKIYIQSKIYWVNFNFILQLYINDLLKPFRKLTVLLIPNRNIPFFFSSFNILSKNLFWKKKLIDIWPLILFRTIGGQWGAQCRSWSWHPRFRGPASAAGTIVQSNYYTLKISWNA